MCCLLVVWFFSFFFSFLFLLVSLLACNYIYICLFLVNELLLLIQEGHKKFEKEKGSKEMGHFNPSRPFKVCHNN